jgi:hypothetical protein
MPVRTGGHLAFAGSVLSFRPISSVFAFIAIGLMQADAHAQPPKEVDWHVKEPLATSDERLPYWKAVDPGVDVMPEPLVPMPWRGTRSLVALNFGLGSAVGEVGITYAFWPLRFLGIELGIGKGVTGTQYSVMQKFGLGSGDAPLRFICAIGVAYATGTASQPGSRVWLNLDLAGLEIRAASHFVFFLAGGFTVGLAGPGLSPIDFGIRFPCDPCVASESKPEPKLAGFFAPQMRVGFGGWF